MGETVGSLVGVSVGEAVGEAVGLWVVGETDEAWVGESVGL